MKKSVFTNVIFYWAIILILGLLLSWNLYFLIVKSILASLLPIIIQATLLTLIFMKHEYAKNGIKIWALVVLIGASGLQLLGQFLKDLTDSFTNADLEYYLTKGLLIVIGFLIVNYTNQTVEIVKIVEEEAEPTHT